uniref:Uncharacterized protein n=1 Tax=Clastoptera arizonana TaxID=38151 RepID=A0A1B6CFN9_9HEMI
MSDNDSDDLGELPKVLENIPRGFVSGWDDDNDDIDDEPNPHETPYKEILWAAENGNLNVVKALIESDSSLVNITDKDGYTPLHRACYNNHVEVVEYLLKNGADHCARTIDNWQPLHSACKWNSAKSAAKLLSFGANVNAISKGGLTPLHLAAGNSYAKECIELLLMNDDIDPDIKNEANERAVDIALRSGRYGQLFEIVEPCFKMKW